MKTKDFSFELPERLIAQHPPERREDARLLVLTRGNGALQDRTVSELPQLLPPRSLVVFNDSRVVPVRLPARRVPQGGRLELLLLEPFNGARCRALVQRARRLQPGTQLELPGQVTATVARKEPPFVDLELSCELDNAYLQRFGAIPLPPYIRREPGPEDIERYQTVYAVAAGSVAAPTAGLHFTPRLLERLREAGHETAFVTLHVGPGTFLPVRSARVADHRMHRERYTISAETAAALERARTERRPVVAIGTTSVRTLESAARCAKLQAGSGETSLFIYPGFEFRIVDAIFTNFHTPQSTLMMLIAAFGGYENVMAAYRHAVMQEYRFFSYGDAMLIR